MLKSELKAYVSVIKGLAKNRTPFKEVAIKDGTMQATNLDSVYTLKTNIKGSGVYNSKALDLYTLDPNTDLDIYRENDLEDWIELPEIKWGAELNLGTRHARRTLGEEIIYSVGFCSQDEMRPALTAVWLKNGEVMATDGYRAYASGNLAELDNFLAALPAPLVKAYKRLAKYGTWTLTLGEDKNHNGVVKFSNGHIELMAKQIEGHFPDVRQLMNNNREFNYRVIIPIDKVKTLQDRFNDDLEIAFDGSMTLNSRPLPFKATVVEALYTFDEDQNHRGLIMGRNLKSSQNLLNVSVRLLSDFETDNGEIQLRVLKTTTKTPNLCFAVV